MKQRTCNFLVLTAVALLALPQAPRDAGGSAEDPLESCRVVTTEELDQVRGGYVADNGVAVSFGVTQSLLVNGIPMLVSTLNLPSVSPGEPASQPVTSGATINLLQNGAGNSVAPRLISGLQSGNFTFIQNSLDRAFIQNTTRIDATVTVRNLYRDLNLTSLLSQQLINSRH